MEPTGAGKPSACSVTWKARKNLARWFGRISKKARRLTGGRRLGGDHHAPLDPDASQLPLSLVEDVELDELAAQGGHLEQLCERDHGEVALQERLFLHPRLLHADARAEASAVTSCAPIFIVMESILKAFSQASLVMPWKTWPSP